jgi:hypothetical protein
MINYRNLLIARGEFMATTGRLLLLSMLIGLCSCTNAGNLALPADPLYLYYSLFGTSGRMPDNPNKGTSKIYKVDYHKVWKISKEILYDAGCDPIEEYKNEGYMFTSFPPQMRGGGVAGVWLDRIHYKTTKVTIVTKRSHAINPHTPLSETEFHKKFQEKLDKPP